MIVFELIDELVVEVTLDRDGIDVLLEALRRIQDGGHEHFASPSWAGSELAETPQFKESRVLHQVTFTRRPDDWSGLTAG
jgi:hypothetical protein